MVKRQRLAQWFLCLACVVVLVCSAQRMMGIHALQMQMLTSTVVSQAEQGQDESQAVTPCELSAKSLLSVPPIVLEAAMLMLGVLLALLMPQRPVRFPQAPPRVVSPPRLRVHLRFCVFRE